MDILVDPATQQVSVAVPCNNERVFYEGYEHDMSYVSMHREVMDWLDALDPTWDLVEGYYEWGILFSSMTQALLFKLTWGGK